MAQANTKVFYDEEECLGFGVFVAELELIIGTSKRGRLDQTVLLELLQKLQASIISTRDPAVLKQHQKRCEAALYDIIYKGSCAAVRSLVCVCLSSLYTTGDLLPLFSRVNGLQAFLQDRNSTASEAARLSVLGLLAHLELSLGRCLASSALESMAIAVKALAKGNSNAMKAAGLKLAAAVVEGLPQTDRNMAAVQAEAWKLFERQVKDKGSDELRAAAAGLLGSICKAGGAVLWGSAGYYAEEALKAAVAALDDAPSQATRENFALALAELAACARSSNPSLVAALDAEKKPAKRQQLEKTASSMFKAALVTPFVEAAVAGHKAVTSALALGWSCYASSLHAPEPEVLVELALKAVAMLELCSKAAAEPAAKGTAPDASSNIGACLAGGEMPAASAAVIYFIRTAIISRLPEPGQRQLLSALATAASHAIAPPVIVAALEGCGVLLEQLGEIHDKAAIKAVQNAATSKLSASSTAVRHQAAAVVAALALSSPPLLAVLFGECLEGVETFCQQLMLLAAPYTKRGPLPSPTSSTSNSTGTGTPRAAPDSQIKHCIDGLHGNALAVGALLVASARSALGAPSRLTSSVFWIAKRMISQPYCSCPWAVAAEREAGYIMLGSMCAAAAPGLLAGRSKQQQVLELFSVALGPMAADALTAAAAAAAGDGALDGREAGPGDLELAVSCWWRAAALQALSAYVMGIMGKGLAEDAAQQVRLIAAMLSPLLEAVVANPCLADPVRAVHAAGPTHHTASTPGSSTAASPVHGNAPSPRPTSSSSGASAAAAAAAAAGGSSAGGTLGGQAHRALGPVAAAAAALLQLRLLEVFFFLPAAQLWGSCHEQLLQLCCRQVLGTGGSAVAPDAAACVAASSLKHMLNSQDALLGPWLPGRDMLEDELRTFVGEPGGPQQHPWEVGAAFTTGFITYSQALLPPDADAADSMSLKASQTAASGHSPGSGGGNGTNGHLQPLGGTTMRRSTLQQPPGPSALSGPQQQHSVDRLRITRRFMPYPQPYALGPALLEAQMWLLGKLLSVVNTPTLLQVLEVLLGAVSIKPGQPPAQRAANCTAVAMAALAGLVPLARRSRSEGVACDKVAGKVLQLASCMLEDQVYDTCLSRAGAELMAAATCLGSAALAVNQVKAIADQLLAEAGAAASSDGSSGPASSAELRSVLSLVLGCIYRARGGSALQAAVPDAVEALVAVASRPVGVTHIWALHGLWLVAGAAGVAYAAHVKQSLQLAVELLVSSYGDHPLLQPAAAQLANAMVAVLGPQFTLGSLAYSRCKTLVTDNTGTLSAALAAANAGGLADSSSSLLGVSGQPSFAAGADGQRVLAATCSELEQVLFAQQLILFAPDAVSPTKHLPLLLLTLTSSRPTLRKAAAATLWHLADRNAAAFAQECIEAQLLSALDAESEASIASQIRSTLAALLAASAPTRPGYWVRLLGAVVLAAGPAAAAVSTQAAATATAAFRSDTPDEEDEDSQPHQRTNSSSTAAAGASAAAASSSSAAAAGAEAAAVARLPATPRLRTRLFAAELLLSLFAAVGTDERHRHPRPKYGNAAGGGAAIAAAAGDAAFLVNHLQTLVDLGFKLTTGAAESLRPSGAQLLQQLLRFFGTVPDPDVPELLLLEQYQAQFVSALRAALKPGAAPALAVCGGTLATSFLSAGLAAGDGAVMKRLMDLLVAPLQVWHVLLYGGFAESVGVKARVALLQAHAQCANLAQAFGSDSSSAGGSSSRAAITQAAAADDVALGIVRPGCFSPNSTINNQLCCSIVVKSQAPYLDMLLLLWWGVLLDYAAFSSTVPGFLDGHKSLLFGHTFPEVVDAVRGTYAAAWPDVLIALASNLPGPQQLAAGSAAAGSRSTTQQQVAPEQQQDAGWSAFVDLVFSGADLTAKGSSSSSNGAATKPGSSSAGPSAGAADKVASHWHKQLQVQCASIHANLIDVCLMLSDAAAACAEALQACCSSTAAAAAGIAAGHSSVLPVAVVGPARRTAISLQALQLLLTQQHLQAGLVSPEVCCDVVKGLTAVAEHVLLPWLQWALASSQQQQQQQPGQQALLDAMASLHVASGTTTAAVAAGSTGTNACAAAAGDKVFGAVLLAASQLLLAVASQVPGSSGQEAAMVQDAADGLADHILEALLVLSSAAVPFAEPPALNSSSSQGVEADPMRQWVPCLPAFTERLPVQQEVRQGGYAGSGTMETVVLRTCQPSPEAVAACSSLCQAAACLLQQKQEGTVQAVWHLALRLMLTAAPGPQLQSGHKLLDSCLAACVDIHWAAVQASVQQQQQQQPISGMAATTCQVLCDSVTVAAEQLCTSSSSGQASVLPDASARLPVLIPGLLQAASACSSCSDSPACAAAVERCCGVLLWCLQLRSPEGNTPSGTGTARTGSSLDSSHGEAGSGLLVCRVLEALRQLLQDAVGLLGQQQGQQQPLGKAQFAQQCAATVIPQVAGLIHAAMCSGRGPLTGHDFTAVAEGLKVLLLLSTCMAAKGEAAQAAVLQVLVPLLIEVAKPPTGTPATPLLRSMACKLVSAMPTSAAASAFRVVVTALPTSSKERLQVALRENAAEQAAGSAAVATHSTDRAAAFKKPAIQLKMNFQLPFPKP